MRSRVGLAALAGGASVFAFSPFEAFPVAFVSLALLVHLLGGVRDARGGFLIGFSWGVGAFLAGVSWLYVALNRFGGMPMPLAGFAILLFSCAMAIYPGLVGALFARLRRGGLLQQAGIFASLWLIAEWLRSWVFTGFPWLAIGYSQTPPSPLAGLAPVLGVLGVGGAVAFIAALMALTPWRNLRAVSIAGVAALILLAAGWALGRIAWTEPVGDAVKVALIQTNIEQGLKWRPERLAEWLEINAALVHQNPAELIVLPETTLPLLVEQLPAGYLDELAEVARSAGGDLVLGVFDRDGQKIYNGAISVGTAPTQHYAKQHLVPFGEYSPPLFGWFYKLVDIPMSDQTAGARSQPPMHLGSQRVALNICYEDVFGNELIRALPEATMLLNLSNLAWYGDSFAQPQHLQIARMRALETGRPMLRATNTGMTAVVRPDGKVAAVLPPFERGALHASVQGYQGLTPYARWGDAGPLVFALVGMVAGFFGASRRPSGAPR